MPLCLGKWKKATVIDRCKNNLKDSVKDLVDIVSEVASKVSENGNAITKAVFWVTLVIAIIDLIIPMDPIPIVPLREIKIYNTLI